MTAIRFVDTGVLTNLVPVPGRCQDRHRVVEEYKKHHESGTSLVLPVTAVIECGNFVAQVAGDRRRAAETFTALLHAVTSDETPWMFNEATWSRRYWQMLVEGAATGSSLTDLLSRKIGTGDISVLVEREEFKARTQIDDVGIWSLDTALSAYS
jgi:hypothetical protein